MPDEIVRLDQQMGTMRGGGGRSIRSPAKAVIDETMFEPSVAGLNCILRDSTNGNVDVPYSAKAASEVIVPRRGAP